MYVRTFDDDSSLFSDLVKIRIGCHDCIFGRHPNVRGNSVLLGRFDIGVLFNAGEDLPACVFFILLFIFHKTSLRNEFFVSLPNIPILPNKPILPNTPILPLFNPLKISALAS